MRLSREAWALTVWTVPRTAFMVITARMTAMLSTSPRTAETTAAAMRMRTRKSANCSRKMRKGPFRPPSARTLGPYFASRRAASLPVRPSGAASKRDSRASAVCCHRDSWVCKTDPPFGEKTRPLQRDLGMLRPEPAAKVSSFQSEAGPLGPCTDAADAYRNMPTTPLCCRDRIAYLGRIVKRVVDGFLWMVQGGGIRRGRGSGNA